MLSPPAPDLASVPTPDEAALAAPMPSSKDISACIWYKGLLDRFIRIESLPEATYKTVNEGSSQLPRYRSTVLVGEELYISPNVFSHEKKAVNDAAKIALESLCKGIDEENFSLIRQDSGLCKKLLSQYAAIMKLEYPVYNTSITLGHDLAFASSLVFNGLTYVGRNARSKIEAELLAAQAVLLDLIGGGDSMSRKVLYLIIKSNWTYTSSNVVLNEKEVEYDVVKTAVESLSKMLKERAFPPQLEGVVSFRAVLNDYAIKRRLEKAVYKTVEAPGYLPLFVSSLEYDGITYIGKIANSRKEAERLAAEAAILSLIGGDDSTARAVIYDIINAKMRFLAKLNIIDSQNVESRTALMGNDSAPKIPTSKAEVVSIQERNDLPTAPVEGPNSKKRKRNKNKAAKKSQPEEVQEETKAPVAIAMTPVEQTPAVPRHESRVPKGEGIHERIENPVAVAPPSVGTSVDAGPVPMKRKRIRSRAAKKMRAEVAQGETKTPVAIAMTPVEQTPAVPHHECTVPKGEGVENPVAVVPPSVGTSVDAGPVPMKRKRIRSRAAKKMRAEVAQEETKTPVAIAMTPVEQTPAVPHHECTVPKGEGVENPVAVVPPSVGSPCDDGGPSSRNRKRARFRARVRARAQKKMQAEAIEEGTKTSKGEAMQEGIENAVADAAAQLQMPGICEKE